VVAEIDKDADVTELLMWDSLLSFLQERRCPWSDLEGLPGSSVVET